jgi:hypothetical protein
MKPTIDLLEGGENFLTQATLLCDSVELYIDPLYNAGGGQHDKIANRSIPKDCQGLQPIDGAA